MAIRGEVQTPGLRVGSGGDSNLASPDTWTPTSWKKSRNLDSAITEIVLEVDHGQARLERNSLSR